MPSLQSSDQRNFGNTVVIESIPPLIVLLLKCPMKGQTGCLSRISFCLQELPLPAPLCYLDRCKDRLPPAFSWLEHTLVLVCGFAESELALSNGYLESMRKKFRSLKTKFVFQKTRLSFLCSRFTCLLAECSFTVLRTSKLLLIVLYFMLGFVNRTSSLQPRITWL